MNGDQGKLCLASGHFRRNRCLRGELPEPVPSEPLCGDEGKQSPRVRAKFKLGKEGQ
jgi:hypothetical protein